MTADQLKSLLEKLAGKQSTPRTFTSGGRQCGKTDAWRRIAAEDIHREYGKYRKRHPLKTEILPFSCSQVGETVHLLGPGVHIRAASWSVASWAAFRLNRQHCEGQQVFEISEIQATLIVGQRRLT